MDSTFCPCHTILALCRGTPQHLGSFPPPQLLLESYKTVLSPGTPSINKTYRRKASFNFIADRPKKAGLRPLLAPKVQALPLQAVRTPCRPLPTRFNSKQDHFPQSTISSRWFLPTTMQKVLWCPWAQAQELLVVQEAQWGSWHLLLHLSPISLDLQSRQSLPQPLSLAVGGTP